MHHEAINKCEAESHLAGGRRSGNFLLANLFILFTLFEERFRNLDILSDFESEYTSKPCALHHAVLTETLGTLSS